MKLVFIGMTASGVARIINKPVAVGLAELGAMIDSPAAVQMRYLERWAIQRTRPAPKYPWRRYGRSLLTILNLGSFSLID